MNIIDSIKRLTKFEKLLWFISFSIVLMSGIIAKGQGFMSTATSLVGVTALIFVSKGDVIGQVLTIIFSLLYGAVSYGFAYYGEMITYVFMSAPAAALAVITWLKHPYKENKAEVEVKSMKRSEIPFMLILVIVVTVGFYFILKFFKTANLFLSTLSVCTSFLASYLTIRRSMFYALAYSANDLVLIVLWVLASAEDKGYIPMIFCFVMFLANDIYGFVNWKRMLKRQKSGKKSAPEISGHL